MDKVICHVTKKEFDKNDCHQADFIRPSLFKLIQKDYPDLTTDSHISLDVLNQYRKTYLEGIINKENRELSSLEKEVVDSITRNQILSDNIEPDINDSLTFGQHVADSIAEFGGSWTFIISFFSFLIIWMLINIILLTRTPFDPYPFILLNLILSCLAAIQAPIIMMSQNRREQKDRIRNEYEYKINLKAELEIKLLHEKLDHLMIHQNKRLLEIQEIQVDILEDIMKEIKTKG
ncbi:MAG TPA: DUF1003 domain-containing protein [Cytophaga sp.]|jgi:uncharacterized membrane protein|nr:DUF1003 domain-containing protein [Cytophaga sp.]